MIIPLIQFSKLAKSSHERDVSVGTRHSPNKQWHHRHWLWQALLTFFSTRCTKALQHEHLERNKGGHGNNPPLYHRAALLTNTTRASWGHCESHNKTYLPMMITVAGESIAATQAQRTQPWSQVTLQTGNTRQIRQTHAPDLLQRERWDQQKQSGKTAQPPWHVEQTSHAQHSQYARRRQVNWQQQGHRPQTTRQAWVAMTTTAKYYVILVDFLK